mmetsp:Transcript_82684/g.210347  ORF Transcript_82684/g.210347 Transcript_82684/m.210347 type:complete len:210 (-) Transcript_82684:513-1142(-)
MPAPCAAPLIISAVEEAFFRPFRKIECQFSGGEPWKANVEPNSVFKLWNKASLSGAADTNMYWYAVPKAFTLSSSWSGSSKERTDDAIHCTMGLAKAPLLVKRSVRMVHSAPSPAASSLASSISPMTFLRVSQAPGLLLDNAGLLAASRNSCGNGSKINVHRGDFAAWIAMHTNKSLTSAAVFTPSASLISSPNWENCQQQISRQHTVR